MNARRKFRRSPGSNAFAFDEPQVHPRENCTSNLPTNFPANDPLPLFLSDLQDQSDKQQVKPFVASQWTSTLARAAAGALVVSAFAILVSIGSATRDQATQAASNLAATLNQDPARSTNPVPASVNSERAVFGIATREDVVSDDRTAQQSQVGAITREGPPPSKTLDAETLTALLTRAKKMLALGDIGAARLLLERAANAQDATAAFLLARTYDPSVLGSLDTRSIIPDARLARDWYRKAAGLGSPEAQKRLTQLQN